MLRKKLPYTAKLSFKSSAAKKNKVLKTAKIPSPPQTRYRSRRTLLDAPPFKREDALLCGWVQMQNKTIKNDIFCL
jgi:hypothetical protein